ncbi:MAG: cation-transporting P-type ATPase [Candidatus Aenigmarchaeota archaeon]|nr:cation-transporting P-type ATPase [Candidatus Aenigmarchaeota archaeon]
MNFIRYPLDPFRYLVYIIIFVSSLILVDAGNALGSPLLVLILIYAGWDVAQKIIASREIANAEWMPIISIAREGNEMHIGIEELQKGDIIRFSKGDVVPAECKILQEKGVVVNERHIGGEKDEKKDKGDYLKEDSYVKSGHATAEVISERSFSKSANLPFFKEISPWITRSFSIGIIFALVTFFAGVLAGADAVTMFLISATLVIFFVSLPSSTATALATAKLVRRTAEKGILLSRAENIVKFANVTAIITDKEAFTTGVPKVSSVYVDGKLFSVEGGNFTLHQKSVSPKRYKDLALALACGMMANSAAISPVKRGEPDEIALLDAAGFAGISDLREQYEILQSEPFSKEKQKATAGYRIGNKAVYYARGSVEAILRMSAQILTEGKAKKITDADAAAIREIARALESKGSRVTGLAVRRTLLGKRNVENDFLLVGLAATSNTVDERAADVIARLNKAGIKVVMATDHDKESSMVMAGKAGIKADKSEIITGKEIEGMSEEELHRRAPYFRIIASATPNCKARFMQALQRIGHSVAITGSHDEDLLYLNSADAPLSASHAPDFVKKEAGAEMKGGLSSLADAVEDANGLKKFAADMLSHSMIVAFAAGLLVLISFISLGAGFSAATISPIHLMWIALLSSIAISMAGVFGISSGRISAFKSYPGFEGRKTAGITFAKGIAVMIIPLLALLFASQAEAAAFAVSYIVIITALLTVFINRLNAAAGVVISLLMLIIISPFVPGFSISNPYSWVLVFVISVAIAVALESWRFLSRKKAARQMRISTMRVSAEGWKGSRMESIIRKMKEMGKAE